MINTILLGIIALIGLALVIIGNKVLKRLDSLKDGNNPLTTDISLIDEVINYIASKGKEPTIGDVENKQYFAYIENDMIVNMVPIEDIEYKKDSIPWKNRRAKLFEEIDKFLEENK